MTPADASDTGTGRPKWLPRWLLFVATALLVELIYVVAISAGTFTHWPLELSYLNDLAEGFRQGHLHLAVEPDRALLAQANPFDGNNRPLWYWDASLYHGHYYLYWGPLPAFLLATFKTIFRISRVLPDQYVVFWLTTFQLLAGALFVERAARRLYDRPPLILQVLALLVVGLANPTLYDLARPAIYEAAIVGGQAFLLLGLVLACDAITAAEPRRAHLLGAGACWASAMACRVSLAPAVALLVLVTAGFAASGKPHRLRRVASGLLWLGIPVALGLCGLLAYNRLRFDSWLEFGRKYQLTFLQPIVGKRFIRPNLYAYLRRPALLSCRFPFVFAPEEMGARAFPPGYHLPPDYFVYEQLVGLLRGIAWSWFAPIALVTAARSLGRTRTGSPRGWAVAATAIAATVSLVPGMMLPSATNRYLGDVVGGVALLGALGVFAAYEALQERVALRRLVIAAALLLAVATVGVGFALGFKGQYRHFEVNNPPLYQKLVRWFSVCHGEIPPEPK